jgi:hypothetical protein
MPSQAYLDKEYQSTHYNLFKESITVSLKPILPPGLQQILSMMQSEITRLQLAKAKY